MTRRQQASVLPVFAVACAMAGMGLFGCSEDSSPPGHCRVDTECPAGERCADGICTGVLRADHGVPDGRDALPDGLPADTSAEKDQGSTLEPDIFQGDGGSCIANGDRVVQRAELPVEVGGEVAYTIGSGLTLDLEGTVDKGHRSWSLSADAADDKRVVSELLPIFAWAQSAFPDATYVSLIDQGYGSYGVFKATDSALQLLGVVSKAETGGTKLPYDPPIDMLRFPLDGTSTHTSKASASGTFGGVYLYVNETYEVKAVGSGTLNLPQLSFEAVLVQIEIEQVPYANPFLVKRRTVFLFVAECYGIVARVVVDGVVDDLSQVVAKERWRLAF